jgi:hypothetical protein
MKRAIAILTLFFTLAGTVSFGTAAWSQERNAPSFMDLAQRNKWPRQCDRICRSSAESDRITCCTLCLDAWWIHGRCEVPLPMNRTLRGRLG